MPRHLMREILWLFANYKTLELKRVIVEEFLGPSEANRIIQDSITLYERDTGTPRR